MIPNPSSTLDFSRYHLNNMVKFCMQLGKTEGIITILRGVPHNASRLRKVYLPVSVLTEHQVSSESLIRNTVDQVQIHQILSPI